MSTFIIRPHGHDDVVISGYVLDNTKRGGRKGDKYKRKDQRMARRTVRMLKGH